MTAPLDEPPGNRLSIAHLMLWTLGSAVILAFYRAIDLSQNAAEELTLARQIGVLIFSLLLGAEVGGLLLFVWRRVRGLGGFPTQPGHWLLLIEGVSALLVWGGQAAAFVMSRGQSSPALWSAWQLPNYIITALAYGLLALHPRLGLGWRTVSGFSCLQYCFGLVADSAAVQSLPTSGLYEVAYILSTKSLPLLTALTLLLTAGLDGATQKRDFLHWSGVVTLIGTQLMITGLITGLLTAMLP